MAEASDWTPDRLPDQHGKVAVVTGANGGLGLEVARGLARAGATVVMAARDQAKAAQARDTILTAVPGADLELRELDLASLASVRECAAAVLAEHDRVDLLVNNAGLMGIPRQETADGFEMQLGVNHLGHFALTARLLPALLAAPAARVVSVTSFARTMGTPVNPRDPNLERRYGAWRAYGTSKLANLHFAIELQRRFAAAGTSAVSLAAHPGLSNTDLQARSVRVTQGGPSQRFWYFAARTAGMSPRAGAAPILRAATDPAARGGELYAPAWVSFGAPVRRPVVDHPRRRAAARGLWEVSERLTGERFAFPN